MPLTLNTATSITDFLKSSGLPGDYPSRQKIYNELGFSDRLGSFVGSANQNTALLKSLSTDTNQLNTVRTLFGQKAPSLDAGDAGIPGYPGVREGDFVPGKGTLLPDGTFSGTALAVNPADETTWPGYKPPEISSVVPGTEPPKLPTASELGIPEAPNLQSILAGQKPFSIEEFMKTPAARLKLDELGAQKEGIDILSQQKQKQTREEFGRRGLFFSGMREGEERGIQEAALADKLGVDRKVAGYMIDAIADAQKASIDAVEKLVKDAQTNRKDAIDRLEKIGYTVLPDGTIAPTLEKQKFASQQEQLDINNELNQAKLELSQAKSEAAMANATQRIEIAQANLELSEARLALAQSRASGGTVTEQKAALTRAAIAKATPALLESKRGGEFIDGNEYLRLRNDFAATVGSPAIFDATFAPMLSPADRAKYGVGRAAGINALGESGEDFANFLAAALAEAQARGTQ